MYEYKPIAPAGNLLKSLPKRSLSSAPALNSFKYAVSLSPPFSAASFKTFLPLLVQHKLSPDFPSYYSQGYLHGKAVGRDDLAKLDAVKWEMLDEWSKTKRAPKLAAFVHEKELSKD